MEKFKVDLINSGYPEHIINIYILQGITNKGGNGKREKKEFDHILRIPYINPGFTRIIKNIIKKTKIHARVVETPGDAIKMMIKQKDSKYCQDENCIFCKNEVLCGSKDNVYKFTCKNCTMRALEERNNSTLEGQGHQ